MNRSARLASVCSLCAVVTVSNAATEEVVVTASKHGVENVQDLPMALDTFGPADLRVRNVEAVDVLRGPQARFTATTSPAAPYRPFPRSIQDGSSVPN